MTSAYVFKKQWKRIVAQCFDFSGSIFFFWLPRKFVVQPARIRKLLVVRIDHLGDALLLRPALLCLRISQPELKIHLLTTPENAPLFMLDTFIDRVIAFNGHWFQKNTGLLRKIGAAWKVLQTLRKEKYDGVIDFRGDVRLNLLFFFSGIPLRIGYGVTGGGWLLTHEKPWCDSKHQALINAEMLSDFGISFNADLLDNPPVHFPDSTVSQIHRLMPGQDEDSYAVIHAGAGNPEKEWPWASFCLLADHLIKSKAIKKVVLVGTAQEKKRSGEIMLDGVVDLRGQTDLHELACILKRASFFIGNDSGPAHLAAAQSVPILLISSATNKIEFWHPWSDCITIVPSESHAPASVECVQAELEKLLSKRTGI